MPEASLATLIVAGATVGELFPLPEAITVALIIGGGTLFGTLIAQFAYAAFLRRRRQAATIADLVAAHQKIAQDAIAAWERLQEENAKLRADNELLESLFESFQEEDSDPDPDT